MVTTLFLLTLVGAESEGITTKFIASGATAKVGGYRPIRAEMDDDAKSVKKGPAGLTSPKYGTLRLGTRSWGFVLDEPEGKTARLFVDTNGDGDFTNDPETTWAPTTNGGLTSYRGDSKVDLRAGQLAAIKLYRFDPQDPRRASLKNTLLFYTDYGYEISLDLDGRVFTTFVSGELQPNSRLWIDRDGNGKRSSKREVVRVGEPFNYTGTTYLLTVDGSVARLEEATEAQPLTPLPPNLSVGQKSLEFAMTATDGTEIEFPASYAGKIVMLDFWATWCGPCIRELPNVKKAYRTWHDKGFEILGISFDNAGMAERVAAFTEQREMPWRQLYEGKRWDTRLGRLYDVGSIPFVLLVDGDSGEILATTPELGGPGLSEFIGQALAKKRSAAIAD